MRIAFFGSSLVSATGTAPPPTTAGSCARSRRRGHQITFFEPDAFDRQRHRDIPDPDWARVVVWPADGGRHGHARSSRRGRPTWSSRRAASASSTASSRRRCWTCARPGDLVVVLGRRRPGDARPHRGRPGRPVPRRWSPATTSSSPTAAATRWSRAYAALGRPRLRPRSTTRSTRRPTTRCRPSRASRADLALPRQPAAGPRGARRGVLPRPPPRRLPQRSSCSAAPAGTTSRCRPTSATSATSARASTTRSTARALAVLNVNRASMATYGFSPADPGVRGRRRRRLPDHRRLGGHRALPRARPRNPGRARRRRGRGPPRTRSIPARAREIGAGGAAARAGRAHLRPPRGAGRGRAADERRQPGRRQRHEGRRPRPLDHLLLGQRPRHDLPRAPARARRARPRGDCSSSATCPGTPAHRDLPNPVFCATRALPRPGRAGAALRGPRRRRPTRSSSAPTCPTGSRSAMAAARPPRASRPSTTSTRR